jgi:hypothetical protein
MALELITITQSNAHWAVDENFRRIREELKHKVPVDGTAVLEGNWNFGGVFTVRGITSDGPETAIPNYERNQAANLMIYEAGQAMGSEDGDIFAYED